MQRRSRTLLASFASFQPRKSSAVAPNATALLCFRGIMRLAARIEFESCFTHLVKPPATVWFAYHIGNANLTQEQLNCGAVELLYRLNGI